MINMMRVLQSNQQVVNKHDGHGKVLHFLHRNHVFD
jgi:hypothetical protein